MFEGADLAKAAKTFMAVSWEKIKSQALRPAREEVRGALEEARVPSRVLQAWEKEVANIEQILFRRWKIVLEHCKFILKDRASATTNTDKEVSSTSSKPLGLKELLSFFDANIDSLSVGATSILESSSDKSPSNKSSVGNEYIRKTKNSSIEEEEENFEPNAFRKGAGVILFCPATQRILLVRRSSDITSWPLTWAGVGGAMEPGETPVQTARREVQEEIGYNIHGPMTLLYVWKNPNLEAILKKKKAGYYSGEVSSSKPPFIAYYNFMAEVPLEFEPALNWENDQSGWFDPFINLPKPLHPGIKELLPTLRSKLKAWNQKM
jgi:8-oxo-dGTP pyrophosphatase MutT (NUDIX family)